MSNFIAPVIVTLKCHYSENLSGAIIFRGGGRQSSFHTVCMIYATAHLVGVLSPNPRNDESKDGSRFVHAMLAPNLGRCDNRLTKQARNAADESVAVDRSCR